MDDDIVVLRAGLMTPVGLSLAETAASARARVARLREIEWRDARFQPFIVGTVPEDGLPPLASSLSGHALPFREARMLRLAHAALEEATDLGGDNGPPTPWPLLLALPEHHTNLPLSASGFLARLDCQCPGRLDLSRSVAVPRGRAAGLMAMREARARLSRGEVPALLVGGVDCLVDLYVLAALDAQGRVRSEVNSDGFTPSEGAAFVLLARADWARERGLSPLARLQGAAIAQEPGHLYAQAPYLGQGLADAVGALFDEAPPRAPVGSVHASFNGERYWAREFGVARLRRAEAFDPDAQMEHPAECFGDLGAAHGTALAALAAHGIAHGYRRAPALVFAASDRGDRGAVLLDHVGGARTTPVARPPAGDAA